MVTTSFMGVVVRRGKRLKLSIPAGIKFSANQCSFGQQIGATGQKCTLSVIKLDDSGVNLLPIALLSIARVCRTGGSISTRVRGRFKWWSVAYLPTTRRAPAVRRYHREGAAALCSCDPCQRWCRIIFSRWRHVRVRAASAAVGSTAAT
eukprot:SAG11_NODE_3442_length_2445_cov_4.641517_1_plen_149_part_00